MPQIILHTHIHSKIDICFDLSRSIDLHIYSTAKTKEKAIDGKISGLIGLHEFVTWEARHFGIKQKLSTKITQYNRPYHFRDEQIVGIFKSLKHDHYFEEKSGWVQMKDVFHFESPVGVLGRIFNKLILTNYLKSFLLERNRIIKDYAETEKWEKFISEI